nr:MAG TPA: hypothetical protein [Caudoviricetes sp.]
MLIPSSLTMAVILPSSSSGSLICVAVIALSLSLRCISWLPPARYSVLFAHFLFIL